jgi:hypothetical protein
MKNTIEDAAYLLSLLRYVVDALEKEIEGSENPENGGMIEKDAILSIWEGVTDVIGPGERAINYSMRERGKYLSKGDKPSDC